MNLEKYLEIKSRIIKMGYVKDVVVNSGIKNTIANMIFEKLCSALGNDKDISTVFNHKGKVKAIKYVWENQHKIFDEYNKVVEKLKYLESLPFIGKITKYHLARNLGVDCCKPDRHLVRIAKIYNTIPEKLCKKLSDESGDRIGVVDIVLWRAGNLGILYES